MAVYEHHDDIFIKRFLPFPYEERNASIGGYGCGCVSGRADKDGCGYGDGYGDGGGDRDGKGSVNPWDDLNGYGGRLAGMWGNGYGFEENNVEGTGVGCGEGCGEGLAEGNGYG
jgi:hypothetical protein